MQPLCLMPAHMFAFYLPTCYTGLICCLLPPSIGPWFHLAGVMCHCSSHVCMFLCPSLLGPYVLLIAHQFGPWVSSLSHRSSHVCMFICPLFFGPYVLLVAPQYWALVYLHSNYFLQVHKHARTRPSNNSVCDPHSCHYTYTFLSLLFSFANT